MFVIHIKFCTRLICVRICLHSCQFIKCFLNVFEAIYMKSFGVVCVNGFIIQVMFSISYHLDYFFSLSIFCSLNAFVGVVLVLKEMWRGACLLFPFDYSIRCMNLWTKVKRFFGEKKNSNKFIWQIESSKEFCKDELAHFWNNNRFNFNCKQLSMSSIIYNVIIFI